MTPPRILLDANATTPVRPEAADAIVRALAVHGNPSSLHASGREAARLLSESRAAIAAFAGTDARSVSFTSGGTEADRLAVLGALAAAKGRRHAVASAVEHPAIRDLLRALAADGVETTWVRPGEDGAVVASDVAAAIRDDTALVAVMAANNETGVLQPVAEIGAACRARGVPLVCDAVQAAGKVAFDAKTCGADVVALAAHKMHGPRGVGAIVVRDGARWRAPFPSSHELGRRAGTEPLALIAGWAAAARAAAATADEDRARVASLRDRLESALVHALDGVRVNGSGPRVPNTTNLSFDGVPGDRLLAALDRAGIDASNGSACSSKSPEPSHVLAAMGLAARARTAIRFSLSRDTTADDIDRAAGAVIEAVLQIRVNG